MASIEDLKKKLNLDDLDKESRGELFNKFIEKGGKVIREKKARKSIPFNRDTQRAFANKLKRYDDDEKQAELPLSAHKYSNSGYSYEKHKQKKYFSVFLSGFFQRMFTISQDFTTKFCDDMIESLIPILKDFYDVTQPVLSLDREKKWQSVEILNIVKPYAYELIIRINSLYKKEDCQKIERHFKLNKNAECPAILDELQDLFKGLLLIFPYWETLKTVIWETEQYYNDITSISPIIPRSKINKYIDKLFSFYLPRLLTILNFNMGRKVKYDYNDMRKLLDIDATDEIGSITKQLVEDKKEYYEELKREKEEMQKKLKENIDKKEQENIPKYLQKGLTIIESLVNKIPELQDYDKTIGMFDRNEKMVEFYVIFKEFDSQYSFMLTTSQIQYNTILVEGTRIDIKQEMENLYIKFNEILSRIKDYLKLLEELHQLKGEREDSPLFNQELSNINVKRTKSYGDIKARATSFMRKLTLTLQQLIKDYNSEKRILLNAEEKLHFELEAGDRSKFEGLAVINAISYTFSFTSAFHYYLSRGKLSDSGLHFKDPLIP